MKYIFLILILSCFIGCNEKPEILKSPNDYSMEGYDMGYRIAKLHIIDSMTKANHFIVDSLKQVIQDMNWRRVDTMIIGGKYDTMLFYKQGIPFKACDYSIPPCPSHIDSFKDCSGKFVLYTQYDCK